jgi:hypothetical protein
MGANKKIFTVKGQEIDKKCKKIDAGRIRTYASDESRFLGDRLNRSATASASSGLGIIYRLPPITRVKIMPLLRYNYTRYGTIRYRSNQNQSRGYC